MENKNIASYSVSGPMVGICKQSSICGYFTNGNVVQPLVYLQKPKWISKKSFDEIIQAIKLELPEGFEISPDEL